MKARPSSLCVCTTSDFHSRSIYPHRGREFFFSTTGTHFFFPFLFPLVLPAVLSAGDSFPTPDRARIIVRFIDTRKTRVVRLPSRTRCATSVSLAQQVDVDAPLFISYGTCMSICPSLSLSLFFTTAIILCRHQILSNFVVPRAEFHDEARQDFVFFFFLRNANKNTKPAYPIDILLNEKA